MNSHELTNRARLAMRIGHRDTLALPPGTPWPTET